MDETASKMALTACMRAPLGPFAPPVTARSLPLMSAVDFCLLTTIWEDPKELEAGRLAADIVVEEEAKEEL